MASPATLARTPYLLCKAGACGKNVSVAAADAAFPFLLIRERADGRFGDGEKRLLWPEEREAAAA